VRKDCREPEHSYKKSTSKNVGENSLLIGVSLEDYYCDTPKSAFYYFQGEG
jgi:hypothetical protein